MVLLFGKSYAPKKPTVALYARKTLFPLKIKEALRLKKTPGKSCKVQKK